MDIENIEIAKELFNRIDDIKTHRGHLKNLLERDVDIVACPSHYLVGGLPVDFKAKYLVRPVYMKIALKSEIKNLEREFDECEKQLMEL